MPPITPPAIAPMLGCLVSPTLLFFSFDGFEPDDGVIVLDPANTSDAIEADDISTEAVEDVEEEDAAVAEEAETTDDELVAAASAAERVAMGS
jgi:hypothetical protein